VDGEGMVVCAQNIIDRHIQWPTTPLPDDITDIINKLLTTQVCVEWGGGGRPASRGFAFSFSASPAPPTSPPLFRCPAAQQAVGLQ